MAILSPFSKILEKIIYEQLYNYFTNNKLFHPNIHGYRKNRSTQTALLQMYDRWVEAAHLGQVSGSLLLDMSAAFDLVSSDILIKKLKIYGVQDDFINWIQSYLTHRYQSVWIDHVMSDFLPCDVGVPQGGNLGPLFFLLFVNDLPFSLTCPMDQYADDSTVTATEKTTQQINSKLEANGVEICKWMEENKLKLNADKTNMMTLGTDQRLKLPGNKVEVQMDGVILGESDNLHEVMLGVTFQPNLKWDQQIVELSKKLKKRIAGLAHVKFVLPYQLRKTVSEGIFNSVLCYCLPLFGGCKVSDMNDLQVLQNRVAKIVTHSPPRTNRNKMFDQLNWLTVNQLIKYHTLLAVFRFRMTGEPEYFASSFCVTNRNNKIIVKNSNLTLLRNSFRYRGSLDWNLLPAHVRNMSRIGQFKKELKSWIKSNVARFPD